MDYEEYLDQLEKEDRIRFQAADDEEEENYKNMKQWYKENGNKIKKKEGKENEEKHRLIYLEVRQHKRQH